MPVPANSIKLRQVHCESEFQKKVKRQSKNYQDKFRY